MGNAPKEEHMNKQNILKLTEAAHDLVADATSKEELEALAELALGAKQVLDYSSLHTDLGQDLLEFAQLKRDGYADQANKFSGMVQDELKQLKAQ